MTGTPHISRYAHALPDPERRPDFYRGVIGKRFVAFLLDGLVTLLLALIAVPFTLFAGAFFFPLLWGTIGFFYRWISISMFSATPGMWLCAIELREGDGLAMRPATAFWHTVIHMVSMAVFPLQIVSIVLMFTSPRKQGLHDHLLGTAAINRPLR